MLKIKEKLYRHCVQYAETRVQTAEQALISTREAATDETKSSAGDKYETTRERMQQEIERNQLQLQEAAKLRSAIYAIRPDTTSETIRAGSVVYTSQGNFYISISAGRLEVEDNTYFAISPSAPVARLLMGLQTGKSIRFNNKDYKIEAVF